ncbi:hypothetical protein ACFWBS_12300 [Streptomyces mirabilis]|uniref:hypothetical protein n=1 Tax=Streptomyces mirabilis TaxID=68239 RepID=UPI0036551A9A
MPRTALASKPAGGIKLSAALTKTEDTAVTSVRGTRSRLAALGEAYTAADTKVTVDRTRRWGKVVTAWVTETTVLTYKKIRGDEPDTTGFDAHHVLTFATQSDGTWKLLDLRTTDKGPRQVNEPVTAAPARMTPMAVVDAPRQRPRILRPPTPRSSPAARTTTRRWRPTPRSTGRTTTRPTGSSTGSAVTTAPTS